MKGSLSSMSRNPDSKPFAEEDAPLLENPKIAKPWHYQHVKLAAYILLTCLVSAVSFSAGFLFSHSTDSRRQRVGTYEDSFKTEISLPFDLPLREVTFHGSPQFFENGTSWRPEVDRNAPWPDNETYFGPPSDEIDASWKKLLLPVHVNLTKEEAKAAWGDRHMEYWSENWGWTAVLDVFHALHCVDFIRKAFYQDRYPFEGVHNELHLEHCLDNIRQSLQCYGSTTLIPTRWFDGLGHPYIDTDQVHTCRDIRVLREWVDERQPGGQYYPLE